jgi:hypothetical protein
MAKTAVADIIIPTEFEKYAIERTAELAAFGTGSVLGPFLVLITSCERRPRCDGDSPPSGAFQIPANSFSRIFLPAVAAR